jgi:hypothetical protein
MIKRPPAAPQLSEDRRSAEIQVSKRERFPAGRRGAAGSGRVARAGPAVVDVNAGLPEARCVYLEIDVQILPLADFTYCRRKCSDGWRIRTLRKNSFQQGFDFRFQHREEKGFSRKSVVSAGN